MSAISLVAHKTITFMRGSIRLLACTSRFVLYGSYSYAAHHKVFVLKTKAATLRMYIRMAPLTQQL